MTLDGDDWKARKRAVREAFDLYSKTQGDGWRALCPGCTSSKTGRADYSLSFDTYGRYWCFRCGTKGRLRGAEFAELPHALDAPADVAAAVRGPVLELPDSMHALWGASSRAGALAGAVEYARSRGLDEARCELHQVHAVVTGFWTGRLVVPILADDPGDPWLGFVGRAWSKAFTPPYRYPRGMPRKELLFNHRALRVETDVPLLVVEGVLDAIAHYPHAVAVLGKPSATQVAALIEARRPVVVVLDGDAWVEGWALAMRLRAEGQRAGNVRLAPQQDPDEVRPAELMERARKALVEVL